MKFSDKLRALRLKTNFNPLYFWFLIIWCISKVIQLLCNQQHTVWEHLWRRFLSACGDNEFNLYVNYTGYLLLLLTVALGGFFSFLDFTLKPESVRKYKVQVNENEPLDVKKFLKALMVIALLSIFIAIPFIIMGFYLLEWRGIPNVHNVPAIQTVLTQVYMCHLCYEVVFYTCHRIAHHKLFYKHVHKVHHEWTASVSIIALYAHPIDFIFSNLLPVGAGVFVLGCHLIVFWMWLLLLMITTFVDHSGYHLPYIHSAEYHDYHHLRFNVNYGAMGIMDWLFGTDMPFRETINNERHRTLFTLKSARELYPDNDIANKENSSKIKLT